MKKIIKILKNNIILIIPLIIGLLIPIMGVGAATKYFTSDEVGYSNANLKKNNVAVTNVKDALDVLYQRALDKAATSGGGGASCASSPFKPGDYVDMTPTNTSSSTIRTLSGVTGSVTPSELSVWRVIRVNSNCTVEMVSEYVSSTDVTLNGKDGYINMVYGLNEYAKLYANTSYTLDPSTAPTGAFREVGYDGQTLKITSQTRLNSTSLGKNSSSIWFNKTTPLNEEESLGGGDQGFATDLKLLADAGVSLPYKNRDYWLASRLFTHRSSNNWLFSARYMDSGLINCKPIYYMSNSLTSSSSSNRIRPIVTLKSGIIPISGNGTSSSHYSFT